MHYIRRSHTHAPFILTKAHTGVGGIGVLIGQPRHIITSVHPNNLKLCTRDSLCLIHLLTLRNIVR